MTAETIDSFLAMDGIPYYSTVKRIAERMGIAEWKIKHALDSGSLKRAGSGAVRRAEFARWVLNCHPEIVARIEKREKEILDIMNDVILDLSPIKPTTKAFNPLTSITVKGYCND